MHEFFISLRPWTGRPIDNNQMKMGIFSWKSSLLEHPRVFKPLTVIGLSVVFYGTYRLALKGYKAYRDRLTLERLISNFKQQRKNEKEWLVLVSLESVNDLFMQKLALIGKFFNIIIVWDNKLVSENIFTKIQNLPNCLVRIIPFDINENLKKFMEQVSEEAADTQSRMMIIQHSKYKGEMLYDKNESITSAMEINYCTQKLKCMTACASVFLAASKTNSARPTVLLDFDFKSANQMDQLIAKSIKHFLSEAKAKYAFDLKELIE